MRFFGWSLFFLPLFSLSVEAQLVYTYQNDIPVTQNNITLASPFSGGFVAPQYSEIDLDNDGVKDLFVFDRASNKVSTYLYQAGNYVYAPYYESRFPNDLKSWVLLRDYNCDGKEDIFTSSLFGMSLYENTSTATDLSWTLLYQTIYTEGSNGQTNLQISNLDLPSIGDVDGDGDIDILNFNFAVGGGIEFHENRSVQNTGTCGLELVRITKRYGEFEECTCDTYIFGLEVCPTGGREAHAGGKSILSFYGTNAVTQDVLIGQEYCLLPGYLPNVGTVSTPLMTSVNFNFPDANNPLRIEYPAFYSIDVTHDGSKDLIAAPNSYLVDGTQNYEALNYWYANNGSGGYDYRTNQFLKEDMIDVGYEASPALADIDFDGDDDLFIGSGKNGYGASVWYYANIGTSELPSFELITKDYLNLKMDSAASIRLQFFDVNSDELPDLVLYKIMNGVLEAEAYIHTGNQTTPFSKLNSTTISLPSNLVWDAPHLFKFGSKIGLLIGKQDGNLAYYKAFNDISNISWQLVSDVYLGIDKNYLKRNLRVIVSDFDANGTQDMLSVDDSENIMMYSNFLSENNALSISGFDKASSNNFNFNFGNQANPVVANLYSTKEPVILLGLLQGGILALKNLNQTISERKVPLFVDVYPNPVIKNEVIIQSNKSGTARIIDATGKQVVKQIELQSGISHKVPLILESGIYFVEVTATLKSEKSATRIVVIE